MTSMPPTVGIWGGVGRTFIRNMLPQVISRDNYSVVSVATMRGEIVGIGILGSVFLFGSFKKEFTGLKG
ncbi:MAG: hypothetical protein IID14_08540 [Candidatus Marinimicrobia bacterium]|nr:hypothetical protein [Candidatus Neomarinimicrobiota bacterium]